MFKSKDYNTDSIKQSTFLANNLITIDHISCLYLGSWGVLLVAFVCFSMLVVLFETPGIAKCPNTLFLLSPYLWFIVGFYVSKSCV